MKEVVYHPPAQKMLLRMPRNTSERIKGKIESYAANPASQASNIKPLVGSPLIRLRVGNWRVLMRDHEVLDVMDVGSRGGIYD